jgi:hypothetical protein
MACAPRSRKRGHLARHSDILSLDKAMSIGYNMRMEPDCWDCITNGMLRGRLQPTDCSHNESVEGSWECGGLVWPAGQSWLVTLKIAGTKRECI